MKSFIRSAVASLFLSSALAAAASPVTVAFNGTVDATALGGSAASLVRLTYTFDTTLANGSGASPTIGSYGPISATLDFLGLSIALALDSGITIFNDAGPSPALDEYDVRGRAASVVIGGTTYSDFIFAFTLDDLDHTMFSSTALPGDLSFVPAADRFRTFFDSRSPVGGSHVSGNSNGAASEISLAIVNPTAVPEPGTTALVALALGAAAVVTRRRR